MSASACVFTARGAVDKKGARGWIIKKTGGSVQPIKDYLTRWNLIEKTLLLLMHWAQPLRGAVSCNVLLTMSHTSPPSSAALTLGSCCVATATRENKASDDMGATVTTVTSDLYFDELQDVSKQQQSTELKRYYQNSHGNWSINSETQSLCKQQNILARLQGDKWL